MNDLSRNVEKAMPLSAGMMSALSAVNLDLEFRNPPFPTVAAPISIKGKHKQAILLDPRRIEVLPVNPRDRDNPGFTPDSLRALGEGIKLFGQQHPIKVCRSTKPGFDAKLIDGERRTLSCIMVGIMVWAVIDERIDPDDEELLHALSMIGNYPPESHTCLEIARGIRKMRDGAKMSVEEIATGLGRTAPWAYNHLQLLNLSPKVQDMLVAKPKAPSRGQRRKRASILSFNTALLLVTKIPDHDDHTRLAEEISNEGMTDTEARRIILNYHRAKGGEAPRMPPAKLKERFVSLRNLTARTEQLFGIYGDMHTAEVEAVLESHEMREREELAKSLRILASSLRGLADIADGSALKNKLPALKVSKA